MIIRENPKNSKEAIFSILSDSYPKKPAELWREARSLGIKITLQGIVKTLSMMERDEIISREDLGFSINPEYARNLQLTAEKINNLRKMPEIRKIANSVEIYTVHNMLEQDSLWAKISKDWVKQNPKDRVKAWIGRHCWWLLSRLEHEDIYHDFLLNYRIRTFNLITRNTNLDRAAAEYYRKKGIPARIETNADIGNIYIESFGKFYIRFEMPKEISNSMENIYKKSKVNDIKMKEIMDLMKKEIPMTVIVVRDVMIAGKIRQDIMKKF